MTAEIATLNKVAGTQAASNDSTYRIAGGKVGVLLLHSMCGAPAEMRFVAAGLGRAGYTVHCPQLAGHGGSRQMTNWPEWYESAEAALEEIRKECDTVIVGGLSLGSIIGLHLAARHPNKVQGVALFSPTLWINGWAMPWYTKLFSLVRSRWFANLMEFRDPESFGIKCPRVREFVRAALGASGGSDLGTAKKPGVMVLEHRRMVNAARKILDKVNQPTLIIHSREDDYAHLNNATYLQGELNGSVDLVVLEDSYHMVTLDKERHVVVERTRAFVDGIAAKMRAANENLASTLLPKAA